MNLVNVNNQRLAELRTTDKGSPIDGVTADAALMLAGNRKNPLMKVFGQTLEQMAALEQELFERNPGEHPEDATKDWRYRMGLVAGLRMAARLPTEIALATAKREEAKGRGHG